MEASGSRRMPRSYRSSRMFTELHDALLLFELNDCDSDGEHTDNDDDVHESYELFVQRQREEENRQKQQQHHQDEHVVSTPPRTNHKTTNRVVLSTPMKKLLGAKEIVETTTINYNTICPTLVSMGMSFSTDYDITAMTLELERLADVLLSVDMHVVNYGNGHICSRVTIPRSRT